MIENGRSAAIDSLRQAQYDLKLPFSLSLPVEKEGEVTTLVCQKLLRLIPEKRMVCAALWGERRVVVKLFLDSRKAGRHWQRELNGVKALKAAGIATPELYFAGRLFSGSLPIIIFAELQPASTLVDLWFAHPEAQVRRELLKAAIEVIAAHHQSGLLQSDIHWSNFIFSDERVFTIDGDAVDSASLGTELGREKSRANIALFLAESYPGIDQHLDFIWQSYCRSRSWLVESDDVEQLKYQIRGHRREKADKYVVKSLRSCTAFAAQTENHFFRLIDRQYLSPVFSDLLARTDEWMADGEILKAGNSATVARLDLEGVSLVVKRYNIKNFSHALRRCWRPSRAQVSWKNAQRLSWWRVATPKPVAMLEKRCLGFRSTAYFISEYVAGSNAFDCLRKCDYSDPDLKTWLQQFAALLQRLIDLGLSHGDFKATNFLCGDDGRLYLLDLDAMRYWPQLGPGFKKAVERDHRRLLANWQGEPELEREFRKIVEGLQTPW
jgi:tRNA A-37 threonylcarbamoyl transferase component Bud32